MTDELDTIYQEAMLASGDGWLDKLDTSERGERKPSLRNAFLMLKFGLDARTWLARNEFTADVVTIAAPPWDAPRGPWTDQDDLRARLRLGAMYGVDFRTETVAGAVQLVADGNTYHPVREYLSGLKWDNRLRLTSWLRDYLGAATHLDPESERYLGAVGMMWMIGAVARIYEPGCKFDTVLILEGGQGKGKSTALNVLAGEWFTDTPFSLGDKDAYQSLRGKWIVELAELDAFNKAESTRAKAFFSSRSDNFRPSYGRRNVDVPRQCVFAGTTNQNEYLRDASGNRRYWPVLTLKPDIDALARDRDQLWAEAVMLYRERVPWWPSAEARELFDRMQALREIGDPWEAIIDAWLAEPDVGLQAAEGGITTTQVLRDCLRVEIGRMDERAMQMRVAKALTRIGLVREQARTRSARAASRHVYRIPQPDDAERVQRENAGGSRDEF